MQSPTEIIDLRAFVRESNAIEGIYRPVRQDEVLAMEQFLELDEVILPNILELLKELEPDRRLRDRVGLDALLAPAGGPRVTARLCELLEQACCEELSPYEAYVQFQLLHPFTDGNGRTGRALWYWMMQQDAPEGFLQTYYHQSLSHTCHH